MIAAALRRVRNRMAPGLSEGVRADELLQAASKALN